VTADCCQEVQDLVMCRGQKCFDVTMGLQMKNDASGKMESAVKRLVGDCKHLGTTFEEIEAAGTEAIEEKKHAQKIKEEKEKARAAAERKAWEE
jgi:hypothetical protein